MTDLGAVAALVGVLAGAAGGAPAADPSFALGATVPAGDRPASVVTADFNGDGRPDLAVANRASNEVTILLGAGDARFREAPGSPVAAGAQPSSIAGGDFDGDGRADLAVAGGKSGGVTLLLGNGAGRFRQAPGSPVSVGGPADIVTAADLDGDGRLDLVTAGTRVAVLLADGKGGFTAARSVFPRPVGSIAIGDFNRDGKPDLALAAASGKVPILLGRSLPPRRGLPDHAP